MSKTPTPAPGVAEIIIGSGTSVTAGASASCVTT